MAKNIKQAQKAKGDQTSSSSTPVVKTPLTRQARLRSASDADHEGLLVLTKDRCAFFSEMQVWPIEPKIDAEGWLRNFTAKELPHAIALLSAFCFFNEKMTNALLRTAVNNVSQALSSGALQDPQEAWLHVCENAIFTTVDIDETNPTASGNLMCRRARQVLGLPAARFLDKAGTLNKVFGGGSDTVIFLDDIICSGLQFTASWTDATTIKGKFVSFASLAAQKKLRAFYVPLIATEYGLAEISKTCRDITILPGHTLGKEYNATSPDSYVWPDHLRDTAADFLYAASTRAGVEKDWMGFKKLGLTLAFSHGIPDATLPIFYSKSNGWHPLMERL